MDNYKIKNYIQEIICELLETEKVMVENKSLIQLGMDSLKFVELILQIEEHFKIKIPDEKLNLVDMSTLKNIVDIVEDLL